MRNCNRRWNGIDWRRRGRSSNLFKLRFRLNCDGPWPRANYTTALAAVFDIAFPRDVPADTVSGKDRRIRWTSTSAGDQEDGFPAAPIRFFSPIPSPPSTCRPLPPPEQLRCTLDRRVSRGSRVLRAMTISGAVIIILIAAD